VDLNRLYFRHQILQLRAEHSALPEQRALHARHAAVVAERIGCVQRAIGAPAAGGWAAAGLAFS
jgi:hypothetical protein